MKVISFILALVLTIESGLAEFDEKRSSNKNMVLFVYLVTEVSSFLRRISYRLRKKNVTDLNDHQ